MDNRYKPFCSSRCKLIDLGAWANESHKIAGDPIPLEQVFDDKDELNDLL